MSSMLNEEIKKQVRQVFNEFKEPVQLLLFVRKEDCEYCSDTHQLLEELVSLSDKLEMKVLDLYEHAEQAHQYHVDKVPGLVIVGKNGTKVLDYGIRIFGIPSGHEFSSLVHDLILVSGRDSKLGEGTRAALKRLTKPVLLQVFVTPT